MMAEKQTMSKMEVKGMTLTYRTAENGLQYPNLSLPEQTMTTETLGKYGRMRLDYLKKHRRGTYTTLLTEARLMEHLTEVDRTARAQISESISQQATSLGVSEKLKAENPMEWVQIMNSIKQSAEEEVLTSLIHA